MDSRSGYSVARWLPLFIAASVVVVLVGWLWLSQSPPEGQGDTALAEVVPSERIQPRPTSTVSPTQTPSVVTPAGSKEAPEFRGIVRWLNSEPLTIEEQRGKVLLIDFWTYS